MRLVAGLYSDSLGELERSPNLLAAIRGGILLLSGREGRGRERENGEKGRVAFSLFGGVA